MSLLPGKTVARGPVPRDRIGTRMSLLPGKTVARGPVPRDRNRDKDVPPTGETESFNVAGACPPC